MKTDFASKNIYTVDLPFPNFSDFTSGLWIQKKFWQKFRIDIEILHKKFFNYRNITQNSPLFFQKMAECMEKVQLAGLLHSQVQSIIELVAQSLMKFQGNHKSTKCVNFSTICKTGSGF